MHSTHRIIDSDRIWISSQKIITFNCELLQKRFSKNPIGCGKVDEKTSRKELTWIQFTPYIGSPFEKRNAQKNAANLQLIACLTRGDVP